VLGAQNLPVTTATDDRSQSTQEDSHEYKFRTRSDLILLPTRVEKKNGDTIYGLRRDQFFVEDNGTRQAVQIEDSPDDPGLSLVVVVQCSKSAISEFNKLKGLGTMIEAITGGAHHEVAVVSYGEKPYLLADFSPRSEATRSALSRVKDCGEYHAATIDAVAYAIDLLKRRRNTFRHAILLIGETRDHGSRAPLHEVVAQLGVTDTTIYSVAFSPTKDQFLHDLKHRPDEPEPAAKLAELDSSQVADTPEPDYVDHAPLFALPPELLLLINALRRNAASELATLSGGEYINFTSQRGFEQALQRISNQIHNYYVLSFKPSGADQPGLHTIRVRVPEHPEAVIQTRKSYWWNGADSSVSRTAK
jgi:VWFA-related protein